MWHWEFQYGSLFQRKIFDKRKHRCGICSYSFHDPAVVWYGVVATFVVGRYADNNNARDFRKPTTWSACVRNIVFDEGICMHTSMLEFAFVSLWQSWNCFNSKYCVAKPKPTFRRFEIYSFNYQTNVTFPLVYIAYIPKTLSTNEYSGSSGTYVVIYYLRKRVSLLETVVYVGMRPLRRPVIFPRTLHCSSTFFVLHNLS